MQTVQTIIFKNNQNLYGSIGSPLKAKTEKWEEEHDYIEENKCAFGRTGEFDRSKTSRLQSLKKRTSMKERYNHIKYEHNIINTTEDTKTTNLFIQDIDKSVINLPLVKPEGKLLSTNESKTESNTKLDKYKIERKESNFGLK